MFVVVMFYLLTIVGYFEGGPVYETLIMFGGTSIFSVVYWIIFVGVTDIFFDDCCRFLKTVAFENSGGGRSKVMPDASGYPSGTGCHHQTVRDNGSGGGT